MLFRSIALVQLFCALLRCIADTYATVAPAVRSLYRLITHDMQVWGVSLLDAPVPEQMKYDSLAEAASHLMQVPNDPEHITG